MWVDVTSWLSAWWSPRSCFRETEAADLEAVLTRWLGRATLPLEPMVRASFDTGAVMRDMAMDGCGRLGSWDERESAAI